MLKIILIFIGVVFSSSNVLREEIEKQKFRNEILKNIPFNLSDPLSQERISQIKNEYEKVSDRLNNFRNIVPEGTDEKIYEKMKNDLEEYQLGLKLYLETYNKVEEVKKESKYWW